MRLNVRLLNAKINMRLNVRLFAKYKINMRLNERLVGCKNKYVAGCEAAECEAKFKNESG